jgi:acyl-coenzyme A thioesterase PaaI-like protein
MAHAALSLVSHAATAELSLQFLKPVMTGGELEVRAEIREQKRRILFLVGAELIPRSQLASGGGAAVILIAGASRTKSA